jgi:hypothetical protein
LWTRTPSRGLRFVEPGGGFFVFFFAGGFPDTAIDFFAQRASSSASSSTASGTSKYCIDPPPRSGNGLNARDPAASYDPRVVSSTFK